MAFKRSTVRSRPSPPEQRNEFSFLCFFCFPFSKGIEPSVHLVRFASAEHEGHIIGDLRSKCEGLAPSIPSVSTKTEKRVLLLCFFILFSLFKRDRTVSPSRAVRLGGARGTYNRGFAKQMRGACPLDPVRLHQNRGTNFRFSAFFILFSFFKRDRTVSPSRAVRPILRGSVRFSPKYAALGILY